MVRVKGPVIDYFTFLSLIPERRRRFRSSRARVHARDTVAELAQAIHPEEQVFFISEIREETPTARTFRLKPVRSANHKPPAYFRAGQYVAVKEEVAGVTVSRPYSLSSAPVDALAGWYELTIKKDDSGFLTPHIWETWTRGTRVCTSGPAGGFHHDDLRDTNQLIGIAGGSGITPFRAMAREIVHGDLDVELTLFYGSRTLEDMIFRQELEGLAAASRGRFRLIPVLSHQQVEGMEQGFLTAELILRHVDPSRASCFICGPQAMYDFVSRELTLLDPQPRRIRREVFGEARDVTRVQGYPQGRGSAVHTITVQHQGTVRSIPGAERESILTALERAGLVPPSACRSGECGLCRSRLVEGQIFVSAENDGRRAADREFGHIHVCASYPLSDLTLEVPGIQVSLPL